jgi:transposase
MPLAGEIQVDGSYFGGARKGKCGRGAFVKVPVFGLLKRGGNIYVNVFPRNEKQNIDGNHTRSDSS